MLASVLDIPRDGLDKEIWDVNDEEIRLQPAIRDQILDVVDGFLDDTGIPDEALLGVLVYGSILTNQWNPTTDVDGRILLDKNAMANIMPGVTGDELYEQVEDSVHDIPLGDTQHPLNFTIVLEGEMGELGQTEFDSVFDVLEDSILKDPVFVDEDFDPNEVFSEDLEETKQIMQKIDDLIRETKMDVIDYGILQQAVEQVKNPQKIVDQLNVKIKEVEQDISAVVDEYADISEKRDEAFTKDPEDDWRQSRHWAPGNVQKKFLERYKYIDTMKKLKKIFEGGVTEQEVDDLSEILSNVQRLIRR